MKAGCCNSSPVSEECRSRIYRCAATAIRNPVYETNCFVVRLTEGAFLEVRWQASLLSLEALHGVPAALLEIFRARSLETVQSKDVGGQRWQRTILRLTEVGVKHD
jgi:hypothetical protein